MKHRVRFVVAMTMLASLLTPLGIPAAHSAVNVFATGTNPGICDQTVGSTTSVTAYRLSGGDCVVEFKNGGASTTWTTPSTISDVRILVVAGGGGGGGRHSGGGGGGGVLYLSNVNLNVNTSYSLQVGAGGAGSTGTTGGGGAAGQHSYFNGSSGAGSIVAFGGGGGSGGAYSANQLNYDGTTTSPPPRGSGGGLNYTGTVATGTPGSVNGSSQSAAASVNVTINSAVAIVSAYGTSGGQGKPNYCQGPTGTNGWCGGGGGGGKDAASAPNQPTGSNPWRAGKGGDGIGIAITGITVNYSGGGGGGAGSDSTFSTNDACKTASASVGPGGAGGGGAGGQCIDNASNGTANTGGGGGGGGLGYITGQTRETGNGGNGGSGIVIVRYTPDSTAPNFTSGTTFSFAENSLISSNVATITVNESSTITINGGADSALLVAVFSDSITARIRFTASPNFEIPTDSGGNNQYDITLRATDLAGNTRDQAISITVTNINEAPEIGAYSPSASTTYSVNENISNLFNLNATDVDAGTSLTYSLTGTDAGDFSISAVGALSLSPAADFENPQDLDRNNSYIVIAWVSDGSLSDSITVTVNVSNVNESSTLGSPSISGTATKGIAISLTVTVNAPGKVRFFMDGKRIANCLAVATTGSYPNYTATCNWKPTVTNRRTLTATFTPSDSSFTASTSAPSYIWVINRSTRR